VALGVLRRERGRWRTGGSPRTAPYEGNQHLTTGWGGQGTTSGFYGGAFRNFPNDAPTGTAGRPVVQRVGSQSAWLPRSTRYTLELTIREDTKPAPDEAATDGQEDSFRLDTRFTTADFDDQWRLDQRTG
jgi:hypothetical protein